MQRLDKANVLLVVIDCLKADRILENAGGASLENMRNLADEGCMFTEAISVTSTTTPSVASILTGCYPVRHGIRSLSGYGLNNNIITMAEVLSDMGYHTYAEVTGALSGKTGLNRGFEIWNWRRLSESVHSNWGQQFLTNLRKGFFQQPYFLLLHLLELHEPRIVPSKFKGRRFGKTTYDQALSAVDWWVGELLSLVDRERTTIVLTSDHGERVENNPIVKYVADIYNLPRRILRRVGLARLWPPLNVIGHGFGVREDLIRIPLIVSGYGIRKGLLVDDLVRQIDIMPTIMEIVCAPSDLRSVQGRSLYPLMTGKTLVPEAAYVEACGITLRNRNNWLASIRTQEWKYIRGLFNTKLPERLYNLKADPTESRNLSKDPLYAQILEDFRALMENIQTGVPVRQEALSAEDQKAIEENLRQLGYID